MIIEAERVDKNGCHIKTKYEITRVLMIMIAKARQLQKGIKTARSSDSSQELKKKRWIEIEFSTNTSV